MALAGYVLSGILMGIFLLVVGFAFALLLPWERYTPTAETAAGAVSRAVHNPASWMATFVVLMLVFGGGAILFVSGQGLPEGAQQTLGMALAGLFGVLVVGFGFWGIYAASRSRGAKSAQALGASFFVFGLIFMTVVGIKLLLGA